MQLIYGGYILRSKKQILSSESDFLNFHLLAVIVFAFVTSAGHQTA